MAEATTTETAAATATTTAATAAAAATTAATTETAAATTTATTAVDDWRADLPDDLKEHATRFTTKADLVRANLDARRQLSRAIVQPGKDAKPEEVAAYRKSLGIPDAPEGYKFPDLPAGQVLSDEVKAERTAWAKEFHEAGLSSTQAERLIAKMSGVVAAQQTAMVEADKRNANEQTEALRKDWGADFDRNKEFANRAFKDMAERAGVSSDDLRKLETKDGRFLFDDARMLKVFALLGREMGEGNLGPVVNEDQRSQMTSQLSTIRSAIETARSKRDDKEANRLYQEEQKLIARMSGNRPIVGSAGRAA